jgi:type IX secretion system substrate protein
MKKILFTLLMASSIVLNATITVTSVGTYVFTSPASNYLLDLDNDGTPDFNIDAYLVVDTNEVQLKVLHANAETSTAMALSVNVANAKNLGENFINWWESQDSYIYQIPEFMTLYDAGYKYIGVRLFKNGNYYYGWIQIKVSYFPPIAVEIVNYAFEDIPNTPITAGQASSTPTSINEINNRSFNVYPNPVKDVLNITSISEVKINDIKLYSVSGALVKEVRLENNQIDMSDLTPGVYYVKIIAGSRQIIKKIIKE